LHKNKGVIGKFYGEKVQLQKQANAKVYLGYLPD